MLTGCAPVKFYSNPGLTEKSGFGRRKSEDGRPGNDIAGRKSEAEKDSPYFGLWTSVFGLRSNYPHNLKL